MRPERGCGICRSLLNGSRLGYLRQIVEPRGTPLAPWGRQEVWVQAACQTEEVEGEGSFCGSGG